MTVAEFQSMHETLDILSDDDTLADLRQSLKDFTAGDTFDAAAVQAEFQLFQRGPA